MEYIVFSIFFEHFKPFDVLYQIKFHTLRVESTKKKSSNRVIFSTTYTKRGPDSHYGGYLGRGDDPHRLG